MLEIFVGGYGDIPRTQHNKLQHQNQVASNTMIRSSMLIVEQEYS